MTGKNLISMLSNVSKLKSELEREGIFLEFGNDFETFRRLRNSQEERSKIFPMFDVACSYVGASNAFWICAFNKDDELIHTQAVRLLDLEGETLKEHLRVHRLKYISPGSTSDVDRTFFSDIPVTEEITGQVAYHGEFWVKGGVINRRNQGLTSVLSRVAFEIAMNLWSPDFMFGLVPLSLANRGVTVRYGYRHCETGTWEGPLPSDRVKEVLVWMGNADLKHYLRTTPQSHDDDILPEPTRLERALSLIEKASEVVAEAEGV